LALSEELTHDIGTSFAEGLPSSVSVFSLTMEKFSKNLNIFDFIYTVLGASSSRAKSKALSEGAFFA
jgi:hypothetical protein